MYSHNIMIDRQSKPGFSLEQSYVKHELTFYTNLVSYITQLF